MNKSKKILYTLLIGVLVFIPFLVNADSGFDTDYGGSSSGGSWSSGSSGGSWSSGSSGSSWSSGSSHRSTYSGNYSDSSFLLTLFCFICIVIVIYYYKSMNSGKGPQSDFVPQEFDINKIKEKLPNFDKEEFKDIAYTIYVEVQNAWMNIDYDSLRNLLTDELFNKYKTDLEVLELKKQKNIMSDYKLNNFEIINFSESEENYIITCYLNIELHDYIVDKDNNVIRGNKENIIVHDYELTFVRGKDIKEGTCPNCHAELNDKASKVCPYCNSVIVSRNNNWVLSNKTSKSQRIK